MCHTNPPPTWQPCYDKLSRISAPVTIAGAKELHLQSLNINKRRVEKNQVNPLRHYINHNTSIRSKKPIGMHSSFICQAMPLELFHSTTKWISSFYIKHAHTHSKLTRTFCTSCLSDSIPSSHCLRLGYKKKRIQVMAVCNRVCHESSASFTRHSTSTFTFNPAELVEFPFDYPEDCNSIPPLLRLHAYTILNTLHYWIFLEQLSFLNPIC